MSVTYRIEPVPGTSSPRESHLTQAGDLAFLHATLLPNSPLTKLGRRFMEHFYYAELPKDGFVFGSLAYVDDQPVGFAIGTDDSNRFMNAALRKLWWKLLWEMGKIVLLHPAHVRSIGEALAIMRSRGSVVSHQREGEILSMGVLPMYLESSFVRKTGLNIVNDLYEQVMGSLQTKNVKVIRVIVDADNTPAKLFYLGLGWKLQREHVPGWDVPSVEFINRL